MLAIIVVSTQSMTASRIGVSSAVKRINHALLSSPYDWLAASRSRSVKTSLPSESIMVPMCPIIAPKAACRWSMVTPFFQSCGRSEGARVPSEWIFLLGLATTELQDCLLALPGEFDTSGGEGEPRGYILPKSSSSLSAAERICVVMISSGNWVGSPPRLIVSGTVI